jgi:hypothetical protein
MQILLNAQPDAPNPKINSIPCILRQHFFRRFFDNDTLSLEAETETTVVRALCAVAVPSLMVAFWLMPHYPGRAVWTNAADRYFFVLYSFVAMGLVATFEWEMLFPDRADFQILLPMPLKARQLFRAKGLALLSFLGMFLAAANLFALILFPAVSTRSNGNYLHSVWAHLAAVSLSGIFAALTPLALEGIFLCLLPSRLFRSVSTVAQSLSITALLLLFLLYPLFGSHMQILLEGHAAFASFIPPLWFLGLYEHLMLGAAAPAGAASLAILGLYAPAASAALALIVYPAAWARQKKTALEGASQSRVQNRNILYALLHRTLLARPQQRGIFHFLSQTIARNIHYQVYLALYAGVGLALAICSIVTLKTAANSTPSLALWKPGLHAVLPLLLFWLVSGLRAAFAFPIDMRARWVFPINLPFPGRDAKSAKIFTLLCCAALTAAVLSLLLALHWSWRELAIQAICGAALSQLLADLFFVGRTRIPFTTPRLPGRTNLAIVFVLYAALFPALVLSTVSLELSTEANLAILLRIFFATPVLHILLLGADRFYQQDTPDGFFEEETAEGPQTLGLSQ